MKRLYKTGESLRNKFDIAVWQLTGWLPNSWVLPREEMRLNYWYALVMSRDLLNDGKTAQAQQVIDNILGAYNVENNDNRQEGTR